MSLTVYWKTVNKNFKYKFNSLRVYLFFILLHHSFILNINFLYYAIPVFYVHTKWMLSTKTMLAFNKNYTCFLTSLNKINLEDLYYIERDLGFGEKVSLALLLFGDNHANALYALQKLLAMSSVENSVNNWNAVKSQNLSIVSAGDSAHSDLLQMYTKSNTKNWRMYLVEALTIINARRVLRKLGFNWEELKQHFLPHINALSIHIHPLLKTLYTICESLTVVQSGRLALNINNKYKTPSDHLHFHDFNYLEIFLLDWLTSRVIKLGDNNAESSDVQPLIEFFKFAEMDSFATLLVDTVNNNAAKNPTSQKVSSCIKIFDPIYVSESFTPACSENIPNIAERKDYQRYAEVIGNKNFYNDTVKSVECYNVRREHAGIALIINQRRFHRKENKNQDLFSNPVLSERVGTDVDKNRLCSIFSKHGYVVEERGDLDDLEMLRTLRDIVKRSVLSDSLIVCILSHGISGAVYGSNSVPVKITDIEHIMTSADELHGKPKMLIIQACQKKQTIVATSKTNSSVLFDPKGYADILKAMSTVPGFEAMRHTTTGSWFIQELCDAIEEYGSRNHLLDILTRVTMKVSSKRGTKNETMVPLTHTTLRKKFFLPN